MHISRWLTYPTMLLYLHEGRCFAKILYNIGHVFIFEGFQGGVKYSWYLLAAFRSSKVREME